MHLDRMLGPICGGFRCPTDMFEFYLAGQDKQPKGGQGSDMSRDACKEGSGIKQVSTNPVNGAEMACGLFLYSLQAKTGVYIVKGL